jgi:monoamine oxidase
MLRGTTLRRIVKLARALRDIENSQTGSATLFNEHKEMGKKSLLSRRDVLKVASSAVLTMPIHKVALARGIANKVLCSWKDMEPIAILGGGLAGLVTAYRLMQVGIPARIYEMNSRLGGRVFTKTNFNSDGMFCELGGELIDQRHHAIFNLCDELGVAIENIVGHDREQSKQLFYVGGRIISEEEMYLGFLPLMDEIEKDIQSMFGSGGPRIPTFRDRLNPELAKYDSLSLAEYLLQKRNGEQWVKDLIEVLYVCEYGLESSEQSALNLLSLISTENKALSLLGESDESYRIKGGNSTLTDALLYQIQNTVPVHLEHRLVRIKEKGAGFLLTFMKGNTIVEQFSERIVCTMPFSVLRKVDGIFDLSVSPQLKESIRYLGYGTNSKLMMNFKTKPWRNCAKTTSNGMVTSTAEQQFWETSRMQPGTSGILTNFMGGDQGSTVSSLKIQKNLQLFEKLFPGCIASYDNKYIMHYWPNYPGAEGSYVCFKTGQYTSMHGLASEPHLNGRVFFAGEHTSIEHCGFMNGAVDSGNRSANYIIQQFGKEFPQRKSVKKYENVE